MRSCLVFVSPCTWNFYCGQHRLQGCVQLREALPMVTHVVPPWRPSPPSLPMSGHVPHFCCTRVPYPLLHNVLICSPWIHTFCARPTIPILTVKRLSKRGFASQAASRSRCGTFLSIRRNPRRPTLISFDGHGQAAGVRGALLNPFIWITLARGTFLVAFSQSPIPGKAWTKLDIKILTSWSVTMLIQQPHW